MLQGLAFGPRELEEAVGERRLQGASRLLNCNIFQAELISA